MSLYGFICKDSLYNASHSISKYEDFFFFNRISPQYLLEAFVGYLSEKSSLIKSLLIDVVKSDFQNLRKIAAKFRSV